MTQPNQTYTALALVAQVIDIRPHSDPEVTRLETLTIAFGKNPDKSLQCIDLVTGKHYRKGQFGIWVQPGAWIPGWLAMELWLVGKKRSNTWFEVRSIEIRGQQSPGLFCGAVYMKDGSEASETRYNEARASGGVQTDEWITWPYWRDYWKVGDDLTDYLGVVSTCPRSSEAEQRLLKPEVTVSQGIGTAQAALSAIPVAGSNPQPMFGDPGDES